MTLGRELRVRIETISAHRRAMVLLAVAAVVATGAVAGAVCSFGPVDLEVYRFGAQALVQGHDPYGPLPVTRSGISLPFIYPPFAAVGFMVLAAPPLGVAAVVLSGISLAALGVSVYVVVRRGASQRTAVVATLVLAVVALAFEPVRATLSFGQVNLVLMALVVADCLSVRTRWPRGLLVGIAVAVKVTPAGFVLFFLLRKDFRAARTAAITFGVATAVGFLMAPGASVAYWFGGGLTGASGLSGSPFATNQTIQGALNRLDLAPLSNLVLSVTLSLLVVVATVVVMRRVDAPVGFLANAVSVLVCSPISWSHHWVWIVPAVLILGARAANGRAVAGLAALVVVFVVAPHSLLPSSDLRELAWTPWQHVMGNSYLLLALGFLVWQLVALPTGRAESRRGEDGRSPAVQGVQECEAVCRRQVVGPEGAFAHHARRDEPRYRRPRPAS